MAKITALPIAADLDGSETVPIVKDGVTRQATLAPLVDAAAGPFLDRAAASAAAAESLAGRPYSTVEEGLAGTAPGQSFAVNSAVGTTTIWFHDPSGAATLPRTMATTDYLRSPEGAAALGLARHDSIPVSVKQFGAKGDGVADDTSAIIAARDSGRSVFFPDGQYICNATVALRTGQRFFASGDVVILGNTDGWVFETIGYPSAIIAHLSAPVVVEPYVWTLTFDTTEQMSAGMRILLHDPVTDMFEVNIIDQVVSNSVRCKWPVLQPFPVPARVLVRRMNCIENASIEGMTITNAGTGGLVRFLYTDNCGVSDCTLGPSNYIGASFESSVFPYALELRQNNCGATGVGFRNARAFRCDDGEVDVTPRSDEPYTVYYNSGPGRFKNCDAVGELFGQPGSQGNSYLIDTRCAQISIEGCSAEGARTYQVLITGSRTPNGAGGWKEPESTFVGCRDINVINNRLGRANLGHVKVEGGSKRVLVDGNLLSSIVDEGDVITAAQLGLPSLPTASIRIMPDCEDCTVGTNPVSAIAGMAVDDRQENPGSTFARKFSVNTQSRYLGHMVNGTMGIMTPDFSPGTAGRLLQLRFQSGEAHLISSGGGDASYAPLFLDASTLVFKPQGPYASNGDAAAAGLALFEWYFRPDGTLAVRV